VPIGKNSDCYDRYLIRMYEIRESLGLIQQCLVRISPGPFKSDNNKISPPSRLLIKSSIEGIIHHFKIFTDGILIPSIIAFVATEAPKGEFGCYIISEGTNIPYRCKITAPGYYHLQALNTICTDHSLSDLVTIIGTQDIVFGEVDR
jgi:NADH-quinone oxidoreductase subunit D